MAETVMVELEHGGRRFAFELCRRELDFGPAGRAPYYWMDSRRFRSKKPGPNFRACVDLWWTAVEGAGATDETDNQVNLVLAECYPLVSTARTLQDIYIDAQLHKKADRQIILGRESGRIEAERIYYLPEEEVSRHRQLTASHDVPGIRAELEALFLGAMPPTHEMPAYQVAARSWIGEGIRAFRTGGHQGLRDYVSEVDQWIATYRKQGNLDRVRRFVNMFSYECKVAFYLCHTSAWVGLIQKLVTDGRLSNVIGERFMRMWHHQNQPVDDNRGMPGGARDVFCGQVLSLHPLSAIVQTEAPYLATIGRWLAHPEYETLQRTNRVATCPEYWDVVAVILQAAHEYDHARRQWEATRGSGTYADSEAVDNKSRDDAVASARILFDDYAAKQKMVCSTCKKALSYVDHELTDVEETVLVNYRCPSGHCISVSVSQEALL